MGLLDVREQGRQRVYRVNGEPLKPIHDWVRAYEKAWDERLDALDSVLEDMKRKDRGDANDDQ